MDQPAKLRSETFEAEGGLKFTVRVLDFYTSRKVYTKLQRVLRIWADDSADTLSPFLMASFVGGIRDEELETLTDIFGKQTQVEFPDGRTLPLITDKGSRDGADEAFIQNFDVMVEWLDFCIRLNFGSVIEKIAAAQRKDKDAAKAQPKAR